MNDIIALHILRHFDSTDKYMVMIQACSSAAADNIINSYHGRVRICVTYVSVDRFGATQILSSLQPTTCMIYPIKDVAILPDGFTALPFVIGRGISRDDGEEVSDEVCPLCLDPICPTCPQSFTTCCNHTFHLSCMCKLEELQCPVCR